MSHDRRHGRGRLAVAALGAVALSLLTSIVTAQSAPSAAELILPPAHPIEGDEFVATFRVTASTVDASVLERITCEITGASGTSQVCDWQGNALSVRVAGTTVDFVLPLVAPPAGDYELRVTRDTSARSGLLALTATAPLSIDRAAAGSSLDDNDLPPVDDDDAGPDTGLPKAPRGDEDNVRWMVSSTAGSATLLLLVVAGRRRAP